MVAFSDSSPFRRALIALNVPPLKGEMPATRTVGFRSAEFGKSGVCFPNSCSVRRQQAGAGSACRQRVAPGTAFQRQLPFQESLLHAQPEDLILEDELFAKGH